MVDLRKDRNTTGGMHKLRISINRPTKPVVIVSLPFDDVRPLMGCWFSTTVNGTTIVLESGCAPGAQK